MPADTLTHDPHATTVPSADGLPSSTPTAAGRFVLGAEIARGGMGVVYAARDLTFGREAAVKVLMARLAGSAAERRFVEEARITGLLRHPGVPPAYDLGRLPDGRPFLAMKLVAGRTLAAVLREGGPADPLGSFEAI
jgi:serine/threonine protein kinase